MEAHHIPIFKHWVPEWLARTIIFSVLLVCLASFALYSNPANIAGFYGVEPADVQYAMMLTYAAVVTFLALDFRFIKYFTSRKYLMAGLSLNICCCAICFCTKSWDAFLICGFIQGIACALASNVILNMVFPRLHPTRARVIGYTVFYCGLQISTPLYAIYSSLVLCSFDFNWLFYGIIILMLPVLLAVWITMNGKARLHKKIPVFQVDWVGYVFYTVFCTVLGYILIYGQKLNWFESPLVVNLCLLVMLVLVLFVVRETRLKRPLINFQIFRDKNFVIGLFLLFAFYIFKGTTSLTYGYLETILGTDPLHLIPIWIAVILGTIISMFAISRFVLTGTPLIRIIIAGFVAMAMYYGYMLAFLSLNGETEDFMLPMFIYGLATGTLFVPIVVYATASLPVKIVYHAAFAGIFARFTGFCASIAINNYVQLYTRSAVREKIRETINEINPQLLLKLQDIKNTYLNANNDVYTAKGASEAFFNNLLKQQVLARATRYYYDIMFIGIVCLIVLLILLPVMKNRFDQWAQDIKKRP